MPHHAPHAQWCTLILIFSFTINIKYNTIQDNENDLSSFTLVACKQIVPVNLFFFLNKSLYLSSLFSRCSTWQNKRLADLSESLFARICRGGCGSSVPTHPHPRQSKIQNLLNFHRPFTKNWLRPPPPPCKHNYPSEFQPEKNSGSLHGLIYVHINLILQLFVLDFIS